MKPILQQEAEKLKRENRELKKRLKMLAEKATITCQAIDGTAEGKNFSDPVGKRMAAIVNLLELETDAAFHFGLKYDFDKISATKRAAKNWAVNNIP